jgi:hypothetical protein
MPRNLRLRTPENLHEVADANLLLAHKVQEPEPGIVPESLKEPLYVEILLRCHVSNIYALTNAWEDNIVA